MEDMPRPRPPYLLRQVTQHGRVCWYVRKGKGKRIRVPPPGTEGFDQAYQAALTDGGTTPRDVARGSSSAAGTLAWLVTRYRETTAWTSLSLATRRQRENILKGVLDTAANQPLSRITKASIIAGKDRRPGHQGRHFLDTMRGIFKWAADAGLVKEDPTDRVKVVKPKIKGFPPWGEEDVAAYRERWPIGTRQRVWLEVLIGTGLRRGDAVMLGKQHVRDGIATIKTQKTDTEVTIPISSDLAEILATGPTGDLHFICNALGKLFTKASFGNAFAEACRKAGIKKSAHGVRKYKATTAAYKGATEPELDAMFGWTGGRMAAHYTREASRRRLAIAGASKLGK
jgi:integrase